jgi:hypothetical protein
MERSFLTASFSRCCLFNHAPGHTTYAPRSCAWAQTLHARAADHGAHAQPQRSRRRNRHRGFRQGPPPWSGGQRRAPQPADEGSAVHPGRRLGASPPRWSPFEVDNHQMMPVSPANFFFQVQVQDASTATFCAHWLMQFTVVVQVHAMSRQKSHF